MSEQSATLPPVPAQAKSYARYLLTMAGLGGLLYGVDVGIIAAALPYIEETTSYSQAQLSTLVMAVLLGSVISSLFAGMLADAFGRKPIVLLAALLFTLSIPVICFSGDFGDNSFAMLVFGRILQGASAGLIGVVIPLYLAECLGADSRGKGTGMFQFLLTVGLVFAALIGLFTANHVEARKGEINEAAALVQKANQDSAPAPEVIPAPVALVLEVTDGEVPHAESTQPAPEVPAVEAPAEPVAPALEVNPVIVAPPAPAISAASTEALNEVKVSAWKTIFWVSILPGIILLFGGVRLSESPRWLYRRGRKEDAFASLARNNGEERAKLIMEEMEQVEAEDKRAKEEAQASGGQVRESLFQKKYVIPFLIAVVILACNQATGINSVLNYSVKIFQQAGLQGKDANMADMAIKVVNCIMTVVAVALVDKRGRKFLLKMGTSGIIVGLCGVGALFLSIEQGRTDVTDKMQNFVVKNADGANYDFVVDLDEPTSMEKMGLPAGTDISNKQLILSYNYSDGGVKLAVQDFVLPKGENPLLDIKEERHADELTFFQNLWHKIPFLYSEEDKSKEIALLGKDKVLTIEKAQLAEKPSEMMGWGVTAFFIFFIAFYAAGPGVCVWLALSELMPTRIRSNGMAVALLINQGVSTTIAGVFLPWVNGWGYSGVFFTLAGFTVIYFITAAFFLPETKGRTLEEIEEYFTKGKMPPERDAN